MNPAGRGQTSESKSRSAALRPALWLLTFTLWLLVSGCSIIPFVKREAPRPGRTTLDSPLVVLPAQTLGNYLIVEAKWDRHGPYHFLIDTGSTVTQVTPELAKRYPGLPSTSRTAAINSRVDSGIPSTSASRTAPASGG